MRYFILFLTLFFFNLTIGQVSNEYAAIDKKISVIPDSLTTSTSKIASYINSKFTTESEKVRATFFWTSNAISYDVPNMFEPNFMDSSQEKIKKTLKSKKGVCIHYAEVFNDIVNKMNITSYVISGYTKQNGKIATISHAWCAAKIDNKWFLFDPTWGAGYVDNQKFYKKLNNTFYKVEPAKMILSHMPFDYLWQFLNIPKTNQEFYSGKIIETKTKINFDYIVEIEKYNKMSNADKAFDCANRIEKNGIINDLILEYYNYRKKEFTLLRQNKNIEKINQIVIDYNQAISLLNDFIMYRNKAFKPTFSDATIKDMIKTPLNRLQKCKDDVYSFGSVGSENTSNLNNLKKSILEAVDQAEKQEEFVNEYISKGKGALKGMFQKVAWFGIPLK
jgi:hypothetical protein